MTGQHGNSARASDSPLVHAQGQDWEGAIDGRSAKVAKKGPVAGNSNETRDGCNSDEPPSSSGECTSGAGESKQTNGAVTSNGHTKFPTQSEQERKEHEETDDHSGEGNAPRSGGTGSGGTERGSDKDTTTNVEEKPNVSGKQAKPKPPRPEVNEHCPRCASADTKFCYYNNYDVKQPRFLCKNCQRYWTSGGTLRNVAPGSGRRKSKAHAKDADKVSIIGMEHAMGKQTNFPLPAPLSAAAYANLLADPMLAYNAAAAAQQQQQQQQQLLTGAPLAGLNIPGMPLPGQWPVGQMGAPDPAAAALCALQQPLGSFPAGLLPGASPCMDASTNPGMMMPAAQCATTPTSAAPMQPPKDDSCTAAAAAAAVARKGFTKPAGEAAVQQQQQQAPPGSTLPDGLGSSNANNTGPTPSTSTLPPQGVDSRTLTNPQHNALAEHLSRQAQAQAMQAAWLQQAAGGWGQLGGLMGSGAMGGVSSQLELLQQQQAVAALQQQQQSNLQLQAAQFQAAQMQAAQVNPYLFPQMQTPSWPYGTGLPIPGGNGANLLGGGPSQLPAASLMAQQMTQQLLSQRPATGGLPSLGMPPPGVMGAWPQPTAQPPAMPWGDVQGMAMQQPHMDPAGMQWAGMHGMHGQGMGLPQGMPMQQQAMQQACGQHSNETADMGMGLGGGAWVS